MSRLREPTALAGRIAKAAAVLFVIAAFGGCASSNRAEPPPEAAAPPPPPPPPQPPPIELSGRWRLAAAGAGGCLMNFAQAPGAAQGTIAPEGGCPGNFFTSRKWTFEHGALIIRDHKSEVLAELSFASGHFEGHQTGGGSISLSR
ncbi:MAG: AprI/Inh family metalloprotease inhibitor [Xanthobacteraceae bacterium]